MTERLAKAPYTADEFYEGESLLQILRKVFEYVPSFPHRFGDPLPPLPSARRVVVEAVGRTLDVVARVETTNSLLVVAVDRSDAGRTPRLWFIHQRTDEEGRLGGVPVASPQAASWPELRRWQDTLAMHSEIRALYRERRGDDGRWERVRLPELLRRPDRH